MDIATENEKTESVRAQWEAAAEGWDAQTTTVETWLAGPTATMLEMAGVAPSSNVLDVAAGAGGQTLVCAARVGPAGRIVAQGVTLPSQSTARVAEQYCLLTQFMGNPLVPHCRLKCR